jgi:60 kDa SS-A/Ro ribonucleoprotein
MALGKVARTSTHLFHFVQYALGTSNARWRRSLKSAVARWYTSKDADALALQLVKYPSRDGWSHADLIRQCHPKTRDPMQHALFGWAMTGEWPRELSEFGTEGRHAAPLFLTPKPDILEGTSRARGARHREDLIDLISSFKLPRECLPTEALTDPMVWVAMLPHMGIEALIRNLGNMTSLGVFSKSPASIERAIERLVDPDQVHKGRVHPFGVLLAAITYRSGQGFKGNKTWSPLRRIEDALDKAFDLSFGNVNPRYGVIKPCVAIDVSGSMRGTKCAGSDQITTIDAAAAMLVYFARVMPHADCVAFDDDLHDLPCNPGRDSVASVQQAVASLVNGGTNCALPIQRAIESKTYYDGFIILTDSESWQGDEHATSAITRYRQKVNPRARLAVLALAANKVSIADPRDAYQMDACGMDSSVAGLMAEFLTHGF